MAQKKLPSLVFVVKGELCTDSLIVAQEFGRRHADVLQSIEKRLKSSVDEIRAFTERTFSLSEYIEPSGRTVKKHVMTREGAGELIFSFSGDKAAVIRIRFIEEFARMERELERPSRQQRDPQWKVVRDKTKVGYEWMSRTLQERREAAGKATLPHHYANEARLVAAVLSGKFKGVDRNTMTAGELDLVADLQRLNAILIGQDLPYTQRKEILLDRSITKIPEMREQAGAQLAPGIC